METKLLIILFALMLEKNKDNESSSLGYLTNFINTMELDSNYTIEKIKIAKKIGPYFPEDYIPFINKSILLTEKLIKINELVTFMKNDENDYIKEPIKVSNNKDRISKIVQTIQNDFPKTNINNMGTVVDLIVNMDRYKKMFTMLQSFMANQDNLKDSSQLINLIAPLLGDKNKMDKDKSKEINNMMEIFKILNSPKKDNIVENHLKNE